MAADRKTLTSRRFRGIFALTTAFFVLQVGFDLAHSVTAFPFVHYAMFSESFPSRDSLPGFEVIADGHSLRATDFDIYRWDMIQEPLTAFDKLSRTGDFAGDKARIKTAMPGLYSIVASNLDNAANLAARFPDWYRHYLSRLLGRDVEQVRVNRNLYHYDHSQLILVARSSWINSN
jgi:hypothetical protein